MEPMRLQIQHHVTGLLHSERFELVKIAFKKIMDKKYSESADDSIAWMAVHVADAVLAAMEKDRGPEDVRAALAELGKARTVTVLAELRAELEQFLTNERDLYAANRTADPRAIGARAGRLDGCEIALRFIDTAIAKAKKPETENDEPPTTK